MGMTVQELIDELMKVEDKSKSVGLFLNLSKNSWMLNRVSKIWGKVILNND